MAIERKQPAVTVTAASHVTTTPTNTNAVADLRSQQQTLATPLTKRKPVKGFAATATTSTNTSTPTSGSPSTPAKKDFIYSQIQSLPPLTDATGMGMGLSMSTGVPETPRAPKSFKQSQDELFSKLEALASVKSKSSPLTESPRQLQMATGRGGGGSGSNQQLHGNSKLSQQTNGSYIRGHGSTMGLQQGSSSTSSFKLQPRRAPASSPSGDRNGSGAFHGSGPSTPDRPREPRRRINSAQFKTPSAADMSELAQIVVANASPPKVQNKLRKRASTLSLTTTTFVAPTSRTPSIVAITPGGGVSNMDHDFRQRYELADKEAKHWEKKFSAAQHQIHYERERWEEKCGALEKTLYDLENSKVEANVEKMNSLLDTVQQLQLANEVFRKQLMDAGIEPDPMPAAQFHSQHLLVGENLDRTFLEQNELMKEQSLITNQKITHLSSELNNVAIAISQTINYVQLRYLTQMLDAAEHVTSQKRTRAMSNTFLSEMLSRGVKKTGATTLSSSSKNTASMATQTPPAILTTLQLQQQRQFQQQFMEQHLLAASESKLSKSFNFSSCLLNLAGLNNNAVDQQYKLRGGVMDDNRSQCLSRQGIPPLVVAELRGSPTSPEAVDLLTTNRGVTPIPKFQYASPTSSQLRIFVPDTHASMNNSRTPSMASGSQASSIHGSAGGSLLSSRSEEGSLRRSSSELSFVQLKGGRNTHGGAARVATSGLNRSVSRSVSQQFLAPEMAILYGNNHNHHVGGNNMLAASHA